MKAIDSESDIFLPCLFSYGGMLSAYMRFKYPNIITGALAASAPIFMLEPSFDRSFFFSLVTLVRESLMLLFVLYTVVTLVKTSLL